MLREVLVVGVVLAGSVRTAVSQNSPPEEPDTSVVTVDVLFDIPEAMNEGTNVRLEDVVVRAKAGNVVRVSYGKHEIFVVPPDPAKLDFIAIGAHVNVQGTLRRSPSAPQAKLEYAMRASEARRLSRTRFYVDAWSLTAAR
jgi:hypothetical protein